MTMFEVGLEQTPPHQRLALDLLPAELTEGLNRARAQAFAGFRDQFENVAEAHLCRAVSGFLRRQIAGHCWRFPAGKLTAIEKFVESAKSVGELSPSFRSAPPTMEITILDRLAERREAWRREARVRPMIQIAEALSRELPASVRPVLFGSLASDDQWPPYADVDLAMFFLNTPTAGDVQKAAAAWRQIAPLILAIDPVQHHGPYVFLRTDSRIYFPSMLPPEALVKATTLDNKPLPLSLNVIEDRVLSIDGLLGIYASIHGFDEIRAMIVNVQSKSENADPREMRDIWRQKRKFSDRYNAKMMGSLVLLVPALAAAALGRRMEKGASFDWFKNQCDPETRAAVELIEQFRRDWNHAIPVPQSLLHAAGAKAPWLARQINRFPSPPLEKRTRDMLVAAEKVFMFAFERIAAEAAP